MSIEVHCPQCQKLIKAPDGAGGKRGKCPFCKASVYIPEPVDDLEPIPIKPVDKEEEDLAAELRAESTRYAATIDHATGGKTADAKEGGLGAEVDVESDVEVYLRSMHKSDLDAMHAAVARLKRSGEHGRDYINGLLEDEASIPFDEIPKNLAQGFLRKLLEKLS